LIGLRELFTSSHHITVRFFFENKDPFTTANLRHLRDSINARVARGQLVYRDTDDPCATGAPLCTITMKGGAILHIMRPLPSSDPAAGNPNNRSAVVKLVGPDSASFTMWLAGDAEQEAIGWFLGPAHYDVNPGMRVNVLKADHHGSCNGVTTAYLNAIKPQSLLPRWARSTAMGTCTRRPRRSIARSTFRGTEPTKTARSNFAVPGRQAESSPSP
jgi:hypothetical protein